MSTEKKRYRISIPVQVYDEEGRFVYAPKDSPSAGQSNVGQRIEIVVEARDDQEALRRVGGWISAKLPRVSPERAAPDQGPALVPSYYCPACERHVPAGETSRYRRDHVDGDRRTVRGFKHLGCGAVVDVTMVDAS